MNKEQHIALMTQQIDDLNGWIKTQETYLFGQTDKRFLSVCLTELKKTQTAMRDVSKRLDELIEHTQEQMRKS